MKFGIVGLGRMGSAIAYRVHKAGYSVIGFDPNEESCRLAQQMGITSAPSMQEVAGAVDILWIMVPAGAATENVMQQLPPLVNKQTIIIDGGNSFFKDSVRRAKMLQEQGISFLDCGTSGGLHGKEQGFSLMVGGERVAYEKVLPLLRSIAAPHGVGHVGPCGAGHYVKMVHNGIEYGLMQAYAEGFDVIKNGSYKDAHLDLAEITRIWNHGAIVRSWLLELSHEIFTRDQHLTSISGVIQESGTGKWTVEEAHKHHIPVTVIEDALKVRAQSRETGGNYATKIVALLRHAFGGHSYEVIPKTEKQ